MSLPTTPVELNLLQIGYLNAGVWPALVRDPSDPTARQLFTLLKEAAIRLGLTPWPYGELPELPTEETT